MWRPEVSPADMAELSGESGSALADDHAVFLCRSCKLPIGDSGDQQSNLNDENIILLRGVTENVEIANKSFSSYRLDANSTVQMLSCKGCSGSIGAFYIVTPRHLEYRRKLFNLNKQAITCYSFADTSKQRARESQEQEIHNVSRLEAQLKKCRTVLGYCARVIAEMESVYQCSESH